MKLNIPILAAIPLVGAITLEIQGELTEKIKWTLKIYGGKLMKHLMVMYYLVVMGICGVS